MYYILFLFISWISVAGALSISFPPSGTPTAASDSQMITWTRDKSDPSDQFVIQKIKLDDGKGPSPKSTPVPINNSQGKGGTSPFMFNQAGLFQILAVDIQNGKNFFSTEVTVLPNPTSSLSPVPSSTNSAKESSKGQATTMKATGMGEMSVNGSKTTTTQQASHSSTALPASDSTVPPPSDHTPAIIGGVVGSVALLFIIGATLLCLRYRTRRDTSIFVRAKMVRYHDSDLLDGQRTASPGLEKDLEYYPSLSPIKRNSLRPQDSVSNIYYIPPILPPIPAARSVTSSEVPSSVNTSSSARRTRDINTPQLSVSTLSTTTSGFGSLFPVPALPPRTRTERQMLIEEDIQRLQSRILFLQGDNVNTPAISRLEREQESLLTNARVERLKEVHESKWALGLTDEAPEGLFN